MSDLGGVTAGSTPSPAPQLRNRLARLSLTFVESNLDMKALIEDNSNFPVATETVTPVITRRSFKVQRPKPISTTPSSPRASTSVFSGRRPNQQPSMDGMMTPSSVLSNADSLSGVGVLDSPVKSRVVTPFRPPQQKTVITPRSAIVKSRSMSPSKRVTFSDGAVVIPDHSSQSSAPSRPAAVVDVTRDKRMALRRVYKRIDSARAELQSCLVKKRAVTLLSVLPPEVQGRVYPQLLDTKLPKDVIDEYDTSIVALC